MFLREFLSFFRPLVSVSVNVRWGRMEDEEDEHERGITCKISSKVDGNVRGLPTILSMKDCVVYCVIVVNCGR